ncbi:MAG: alkaline phosphatase D family protein [Tahibacter sp.]
MRERSSPLSVDPARRRWLRGALAVAGLGMSGAIARVAAPTGFGDDPFSLGVASGDPSEDGFVIWSRLAPRPLQIGGGMDPIDRVVHWEVSDDHQFRRIVKNGTTLARTRRAHAVHVDVRGLAAGRVYHYRFHCAGAVSATGRAKTLPAALLPADRLRFVVASCQHYEHGWFAAHRHIAASDVDFVLHLGDYIYEGSYGERVRRFESTAALQNLDDYRARHACYKLDPDLQAAHAACAWLPIWDDHEVGNDYAGDLAMDGESLSQFALRRAAAYRAWLEHMPVRAALREDDTRIFRRLRFGALAELHLLDDRQYRAPQPCAPRDRGYAPMIDVSCVERDDAQRSLLGTAQEGWLLDGLGAGGARWNLLGQQTLIAPLVSHTDEREEVWSDAWDGYTATRQRLLDRIAEARIPNVVSFGGDVHAFYANDLKRNFDDTHSAAIASEFVTGSLTTDDVDHDAVLRDLPRNPHVRAFESRWRGWLDCDLGPERLDLRWQMLSDARDPLATTRTFRQFSVVHGQPGVQA